MVGIIVACLIGLLAILTVYGAAVNEGRYQQHHPPDGNGIQEDKSERGEP